MTACRPTSWENNIICQLIKVLQSLAWKIMKQAKQEVAEKVIFLDLYLFKTFSSEISKCCSKMCDLSLSNHMYVQNAKTSAESVFWQICVRVYYPQSACLIVSTLDAFLFYGEFLTVCRIQHLAWMCVSNRGKLQLRKYIRDGEYFDEKENWKRGIGNPVTSVSAVIQNVKQVQKYKIQKYKNVRIHKNKNTKYKMQWWRLLVKKKIEKGGWGTQWWLAAARHILDVPLDDVVQVVPLDVMRMLFFTHATFLCLCALCKVQLCAYIPKVQLCSTNQGHRSW